MTRAAVHHSTPALGATIAVLMLMHLRIVHHALEMPQPGFEVLTLLHEGTNDLQVVMQRVDATGDVGQLVLDTRKGIVQQCGLVVHAHAGVSSSSCRQ